MISHPLTSRQYLERYVNDGSPSGFSTINTTSFQTSPFETTPWFNPYICIAPIECFREYGQIPSYLGEEFSAENNWVMVHPDMVSRLSILSQNSLRIKSSKYRVSPTASGRTVQILNSSQQDYVKLHYAGILGRVSRELPYHKAIAGPELSKIITNAIDNKLLHAQLSLLPEPGARTLVLHSESMITDWGMVWRESKPYGLNSQSTVYVFPSFSLFSYDRLAVHHYPLLKQIIDYTSFDPQEFVFDVILEPLITCYFNMINTLGLQPEWNSQNLLVSFDASFTKAHFIMRDLESIDKDLSLMKALGKEYHFECYPYKCIENTQYNYQIKHSFMYDFKLGECIIDPILQLLVKYYAVNIIEAREKIKHLTSKLTDKLPNDFFPKNKWYVFDKVLVDHSIKERPYIELQNPKYRS